MIAVSDYLEQILNQIKTLEIEITPLEQALGTTLASDLPARYAVPPFTNSAMDGFAICFKDLESLSSHSKITLPVSGDIPAGSRENFILPTGNACRIMTGAPLPQAADTVVKIEDTNLPSGPLALPSQVTINKLPKKKANVRKQGEDICVGEIGLRAGQFLSPAALSAAAAIGYKEIPVYRRPQVAIISTGDELQAVGSELSYGQIPDSNSVLLASLFQQFGIPVVFVKRVSDTPADFLASLQQAAKVADLIITSGGISTGNYDVVKQIGKKYQISFNKVAMQPGKPQGFGIFHGSEGDSAYLLTLPGNPVSVFVSFQVFVRPILAALQGQDPSTETIHQFAQSTTSWASPAGKTQFMPVSFKTASHPTATATITPIHRLGSGSHLVASLFLANALALVAPTVDKVREGDMLEVLLTCRSDSYF